ncbi:hypothetical protein CLV94_3054 [Flavobacterium endophyticum]|uniref:Uncharacterized protein n=1 Tax=Flavobacterium endophyticum TaxID=1540163 RepID=A0A495M3B5_9FLAO|nr:hypothetical protein [Flavobacterium endophyticum]RKS19103.1 hypothetical protein CLV94_3054 [Flavobacterium endophyticum]
MSDFINNFSNALDGSKFWTNYHNFCDNLYKEDIVEDELLILVPKIFKKIENDMASYQIFKAINKLSEFQPKKAKIIYDKILELNDEKLLTLIPEILNGISKSQSNINIIEQIKFLIENHNINFQRQGYNSILYFDQKKISENIDFIRYLDDRITINLKSNNTFLFDVVTKVLGNLRSIIPNAEEYLLLLSETKLPEVQYEIAHLLQDKIKIEDTKLFENLLLSLHKVDPKYLGVINIINHLVLPNIIKKMPDLLFYFFKNWLLFDVNRYKDIILFENVFVKIYKENNNLFKKIITSWLNSNYAVYHKALNKLLLKISIRDINSIEVCEEDISNLNASDIKFISMKIIGYIYFKEQLRSILYSMLKAKIEDDESVHFIKAMFNEYVIFNYPSTLEYFKEVKKNAPKKVKLVISEMEKVNNEYFENINNLKHINEFNASDKRLNLYNNIHKKEFESLQKENKKNDTSFLSIVTKIQIRTGKGMFSKYQGSYTEKTEMTAFE